MNKKYIDDQTNERAFNLEKEIINAKNVLQAFEEFKRNAEEQEEEEDINLIKSTKVKFDFKDINY